MTMLIHCQFYMCHMVEESYSFKASEVTWLGMLQCHNLEVSYGLS